MSFPEVDDPIVISTGPSARGWHRLQTASECLQRYAFSYEDGPRKDISKKPPLAVGTLIHLALAQFYSRMKQEQEGKNPNEYMDPAEAVTLFAQVRGTDRHVPNVLATFRAYEQRYWQDINTRRIVEVEALFDGFLHPTDIERLAGFPSYRLTGRVDLMYEDLGGRLWGEDHKSTSRMTKRHRDYFSISGQLLGYEHLCREKYPDLIGFKINLIQHAGSLTPKFERFALQRRDALVSQFVARAIDIEQSIERVRAEKREVDEWPKAMSELVCYHRYGPCEYIDRCRSGPNAKAAGAWSWED